MEALSECLMEKGMNGKLWFEEKAQARGAWIWEGLCRRIRSRGSLQEEGGKPAPPASGESQALSSYGESQWSRLVVLRSEDTHVCPDPSSPSRSHPDFSNLIGSSSQVAKGPGSRKAVPAL